MDDQRPEKPSLRARAPTLLILGVIPVVAAPLYVIGLDPLLSWIAGILVLTLVVNAWQAFDKWRKRED